MTAAQADLHPLHRARVEPDGNLRLHGQYHRRTLPTTRRSAWRSPPAYEHRKNKALRHAPIAFVNALPTNIPTPASGAAFASNTTTTVADPDRHQVGQYSLNEIYAEAAIPLLKDVALAKSARYQSWPPAIRTTTPSAATAPFKVGVGWKSDRGHPGARHLRAGLPRAVDPGALTKGGAQTSFQGTDPCNGGATRPIAKPARLRRRAHRL